MKKSRIGVLTGGGDCAGLNPALKWVVKTAMDERLEWERGVRYEVMGIRDGWKGLANVDPSTWDTAGHIIPLNPDAVRTWDRYGGTMLGTSRFSPYDPKNECSKLVIENIERLGLEAIIAIGGDGTLAIATRMFRAGVNTIGIPKTIDKDLPETDYSLGYETALNVIVEEVDRLRTTAGSHKRIFVVETMGRTAGWLALEGGEACGAYIILIPECDFSIDKVNELVSEGRRSGTRYEIIVVAEGAKPKGGTEVVKKEGVDSFGHKALGGIGEFIAREIEKGTKLETRSVNLSHLQRGGAPCAYDRRMGRYFGIAAVDLVVRKKYGNMVCVHNGKISFCPLENIYGKLKLVDVATEYDVDRYNGRRTILYNGKKKKNAG
ncbi:MAG TPA: ATP-dependent 6-phosphofructokinase [Dehalococcoidales bacterium]|nr:ATP-dependent 6-phosphofructokinase [Dehalococcoidales bacterium]